MRTEKRAAERLRRRLAGNGGFSLTELLLCVIIMVLAGGLITQAFDLGIRQFRERTRDSEASLLCNSLAIAVRRRLSSAYEVTLSGDELVSFKTGADGFSGAECKFLSDAGGQALLSYGGALYPLVSRGNYAVDAAGRAALRAAVKVTYPGTGDTFSVEIAVSDGAGNALTDKKFQVTSVREVSANPSG